MGAAAPALRGEAPRVLPATERAEIAAEHYDGLLALYGPAMGVRHARKHLAAYAEAGAGLDAAERTRLLTTTDPNTARALLRAAFLAPARAVPEAA